VVKTWAPLNWFVVIVENFLHPVLKIRVAIRYSVEVVFLPFRAKGEGGFLVPFATVESHHSGPMFPSKEWLIVNSQNKDKRLNQQRSNQNLPKTQRNNPVPIRNTFHWRNWMRPHFPKQTSSLKKFPKRSGQVQLQQWIHVTRRLPEVPPTLKFANWRINSTHKPQSWSSWKWSWKSSRGSKNQSGWIFFSTSVSKWSTT